MNVQNSIGTVQGILLLVFSAVLIWVAIRLTATRVAKGDLSGSFSSLGAAIAPILLIAIAVGAAALAIGSGLLDSLGITSGS